MSVRIAEISGKESLRFELHCEHCPDNGCRTWFTGTDSMTVEETRDLAASSEGWTSDGQLIDLCADHSRMAEPISYDDWVDATKTIRAWVNHQPVGPTALLAEMRLWVAELEKIQ